MPLLRQTAPLLILSALGACSHAWVPGPNAAADFPTTRARCSIMARHGGSSISAYGSTRFVAGALIGNAIGNAFVAHEDFDDCMQASGYLIADKLPPQGVATAPAPLQTGYQLPNSVMQSVNTPAQLPASSPQPLTLSAVTQPGAQASGGDITYNWKANND